MSEAGGKIGKKGENQAGSSGQEVPRSGIRRLEPTGSPTPATRRLLSKEKLGRKRRFNGGHDGEEDDLAKQLVKDLTPGEDVKSTFVVSRKELRKTRAGSPYLAVELADKSGKVEGRVWDRAGSYKDAFAEKDYVAVSGRVETYRERKQVIINSLRRCREEEVDAGDFLRVVATDRSELEGELRLSLEGVSDPYLRKLLSSFLDDEGFMRRFTGAPAAKNYHHPYLGGLLEHTATTVRICGLICDLYPELDRDLLVCAAALHDIGKIRELDYQRSIDFTDAGRFLGHLLLSDEMIRERIAGIPSFPGDLALRLRHAVLSHHGELEWGSPKRPKTLEAVVLHHVDNLDAKVNSFREIAERSSGSESPWTDMRNLFKRPLYIPKAMSQEMDLGLDEELPR